MERRANAQTAIYLCLPGRGCLEVHHGRMVAIRYPHHSEQRRLHSSLSESASRPSEEHLVGRQYDSLGQCTALDCYELERRTRRNLASPSSMGACGQPGAQPIMSG